MFGFISTAECAAASAAFGFPSICSSCAFSANPSAVACVFSAESRMRRASAVDPVSSAIAASRVFAAASIARLGAAGIFRRYFHFVRRVVDLRTMIDGGRILELRDRLVDAVRLAVHACPSYLRIDVALVALERMLRSDQRLAEPSGREQEAACL